MIYGTKYYYGEDGSDGEHQENTHAPMSGWSGILGDVDDFIFYYGAEDDGVDNGEYRSTR